MHPPLQPLLHEELVVLRAPTQAWSDRTGQMQSAAIHGIYFSDVRVVRGLRIRVGDRSAEHLATSGSTADHVRIDSLLRDLDSSTPDPGVRLLLDRSVNSAGVSDQLTLRNRHEQPLATTVVVELDLDASSMDDVKMGEAPASHQPVTLDRDSSQARARWGQSSVTTAVSSSDFTIESTASGIRLSADVEVPGHGEFALAWRLDARDSIAVVRGDDRPVPWSVPQVESGDQRLSRWIARALTDLDALRMTTVANPESSFLAAGAPWFFTLFGRDAIWSARFMLPLGTSLAGDTLRLLAALQGTTDVPETAEEPGKIMHELRRESLEIGDGVILPPLYFGTVDATALWVCLLHDAWRWGLAEEEVRELLPALEAALSWMRDFGDADGDGLLEYVDKSGHGLANQGWKDSGDSVQWRDGTLAEGPIALCEVQAYAYEAAMHGADLLDHFGRPGADDWRAWAGHLRSAFHDQFWITDPETCGDLGPYPAIALDARKNRVDTVTSNLGHLLGTGLLDDDQSALVATRLGSPELNSGFGLRTMSTDSSGYWPLSYHGGSVWTHDTAIAILGLARDGHDDVAVSLAQGLLRAAEGFEYRLPELHSGDDAADTASPVPYPAACRPQAWSAAASVAVLTAALRLVPDAAAATVSSTPLRGMGSISVTGLVVDGTTVEL